MRGLLLRLLDDTHGSIGESFWHCFRPLQSTFDRYYWIYSWQPWMAVPSGFEPEQELVDYEGIGATSVGLLRPGAVGRWADEFSEEHIELWAANPTTDPARLATEFQRTFFGSEATFIEDNAELWIIYSDSTCWEFFAKDASLLPVVREHLRWNKRVEVYESNSSDRGRAYFKAGLGEVWRAKHGKAN